MAKRRENATPWRGGEAGGWARGGAAARTVSIALSTLYRWQAGAVERAQGSWRYEFYACFDLPHRIDKLQAYVDAFAHRYHHRPHQALGDQTPAEYLNTLSRRPPASHMS